MPRKLTRDTKHAVVAGVAAGFGRYLDVDPVLARLGFVLLAFVNGLGLLVYLAGWALMPREEAVPVGATGAAAPADGSPDPSVAAGFESLRNASDQIAAEVEGNVDVPQWCKLHTRLRGGRGVCLRLCGVGGCRAPQLRRGRES